MRPRFLVTALSLAAALLPAAAPAAAPEWRLVALRTFAHRVTAAGFIDARRGLTVGGAGAGNMAYVFTTADGGKTWREAASPSWRRHALELSAAGFAWHAGVLQIGRSFDFGRTWYHGGSFGESDPGPVVLLSFADENRGLAATARRLGRTDDGGLRWTEVPLPEGVEELAAVSLEVTPPEPGAHAPSLVRLHTIRPVVARALDAAGGLWTDAGAGAGWQRAASPLAGARLHRAGGAATAALRFTPAGAGALAAFVEEGAGFRLRVWRATEGGASWAEERTPVVREPGALFFSPDGEVLTWKSLERAELRVYARRVLATRER
jgi:hypothetical protein